MFQLPLVIALHIASHLTGMHLWWLSWVCVYRSEFYLSAAKSSSSIASILFISVILNVYIRVARCRRKRSMCMFRIPSKVSLVKVMYHAAKCTSRSHCNLLYSHITSRYYYKIQSPQNRVIDQIFDDSNYKFQFLRNSVDNFSLDSLHNTLIVSNRCNAIKFGILVFWVSLVPFSASLSWKSISIKNRLKSRLIGWLVFYLLLELLSVTVTRTKAGTKNQCTPSCLNDILSMFFYKY